MSTNALVLGGGFAGLEAAIRLQKSGMVDEVTLVSDRPYLFIYPTSIWVATGQRKFEKVCLDLEGVAKRHGFKFRQGEVQSISGKDKTAVVSGESMTADMLFVAIGGVPMRPSGIEHTYGISGRPEGVVQFRDALQDLVAKGKGRIAMGFGGNPTDPSAARGGPVFEVMFNVDHWLRKQGIRQNFELTFFAPMPTPGEKMGKKAVQAIQSLFTKKQIAMHFGKKIKTFEAGGNVRFEDDTTLGSDVTLFVPGHTGHPVLKKSDMPLSDAGFVVTDEGCAVTGFPGVYAIGDAAALLGPDWKAKQGHMAELMAHVAVANALSELKAQPRTQSYLPHVSIICLMDMGNGGALVKRTETVERVTPLPVVGHWMKKGWGSYFRMSKMKQVPRLPGM